MEVQSLDHLRRIGVRTAGCIILAMMAVVIATTLRISPGDIVPVAIGVGAISFLPLLMAWRGLHGTAVRVTFGVTIPLFPALLVFIMRGHAWQMDMHMAFFAGVAMLLILCDWRAILAGTLVTATHHLLLTLVMPTFVFNSDSNIGRVILHAVILLVEAGVLMTLAHRLTSLVEAVVRSSREAREAELARQAAEAARQAEQAATMERQEATMSTLQQGLSAISRGDLRYRITDMPADFARLKTDFNDSVASLSAMIGLVAITTSDVGAETSVISQSSSQLARHSEAQAAVVEEATAALASLTGDVRSISDRARQAAERMDQMEADSSKGGQMATSMRTAMGDVVSATSEIAEIVDVIDQISFQTNLLALNAGVEAARAGDAGHGFAVVANEVRALSERTGHAAKDVRALITRTQQRLDVGVDYVNGSAGVLDGLSASISGINQLMQQIMGATGNQSEGLKSISEAVEEINRASQRGAAMAEESDAAVDRLRERTSQLSEHVSRYEVDAAPRERSLRRAA